MKYAVINPQSHVYKSCQTNVQKISKLKIERRNKTSETEGDIIQKPDGRIARVVGFYTTGFQKGQAKLKCIGTDSNGKDCNRNITSNTCPCVQQTHSMHTDRLNNRRFIVEPWSNALNQLCIRVKGCNLKTLHKYFIDDSRNPNIINKWGLENGYSCDHKYGGCNFDLTDPVQLRFVRHYKNQRILSNKNHAKKSAIMDKRETKFIKHNLANFVTPEAVHNKLRLNINVRMNAKIARINRSVDCAKLSIKCMHNVIDSINKR